MTLTTKTFSNQNRLPRLPIPPVQHTIKKYLESLEPILSPDALQEARRVVSDFVNPVYSVKSEQDPNSVLKVSVADLLQERLKKYDKSQQFHWLETWWEEAAYLTWRDPLIVNSNYWLTFEQIPNAYGQIQDKNLMENVHKLTKEQKKNLVVFDAGFSEFQIRLAAAVANRSIDFYESVQREELEIETAGGKPICMNQYTNLFGITRLPQAGKDEIAKYKGKIAHFILMARDQLYKIPLYTKNGNRLLDGDLEDLIAYAVSHVEDTSANRKHEMEPPIGVLTAGHRDRWAVGYAFLAQSLVNPISAGTFEEVKKAAFVISLEDYYCPLEIGGHSSMQKLVKAGGIPGHNRWFDKHINYTVDRNGNLGLNGEHSPADAVVPAKLYDYVLRCLITDNKEKGYMAIRENRSSPSAFRKGDSNINNGLIGKYNGDEVIGVEHLKFGPGGRDPLINKLFLETKEEIEKICDESLSETFDFKGFGGSTIKKLKVSPDSFVQMALQLSYYKIHKEVAPTYESASTRMYSHGRTETIRSLTNEAKRFVENMYNYLGGKRESGEEISIVYKSLEDAAKKHVTVSRLAAQGMGIDRHLLGLRFAYTKLAPLAGEPRIDDTIVEKFFNSTESGVWLPDDSKQLLWNELHDYAKKNKARDRGEEEKLYGERGAKQ
ncbi:hypothetical protein BB559_001274 [Furculomyces boomerangus]|uniref:Choline/carnitine acyltransferase domain-containing protein n=1 Tax=Furculomyces boomerangus TaxID=61424 RepID=A0A2T9Z2Q0_9FUNG|nr:hypothetical protein BB559_001274 [Furculomyces boomerangus]